MCAPGCIEHVRAKLSRRGFFKSAGAAAAGVAAASLAPAGVTLVVGAPKIKGATGGPTRVLALI